MRLSPPAGISATFWTLLLGEPLHELSVLDVGTGTGRLALALAPLARRVVGIEREPALVAQARDAAARLCLTRVSFEIADAEAVDYERFAPDIVVAHLCMSDPIVERAARALVPGHALSFVSFHADQWRETGRRSRFAYDEEEMRALLHRTGFSVEHLAVEPIVSAFRSAEEALAAVADLESRWRADGRWERYVDFVGRGGRSLTRSHLVVKARRI